MSTDNVPKTKRPKSGGLSPSFLPVGNPPARIGYICAWLGLIPGLGVLFGWPAIFFGILGKRHAARDADKRGGGHAFVCRLAGSIEIVSNAAGWYVLALAADWL